MEAALLRSSATQRAPTEGWTPADAGPVGLAGFAMTTFVLSMFNAKLVGSGGEPVVLGLALACGGSWGAHENVIKWGGCVGLATAVAAWYASFGAVADSTFGRTVLPVMPLKR